MRLHRLSLVVLAAGVTLAGCAPQYTAPRSAQSAPTAHQVVRFVGVDADWISEDVRSELAWIREETRRFDSIDDAIASGYDTRVTECMASPDGGQGVHYGNPRLIDDGGRLDPLTPELLMYEPQPDGTMTLVGIEYIVPFKDWKRSQPPRLLGRQFHRNEEFGIWVLHVWWRDNPNGQFTNWNPAVSCR